ncbi:unnamed protein product [Phytophthora fragariaefolia]|uniref:Unnamed protein product n=1 Tax=Phytophthora fragariaefolia TaxID=1490495 RepID=A0A9W6XMB6_9STRA|nr:unnamed protein product [Phytophthora fragariaefolia]
MTLQASEIDRHFNCFVDDVDTRIKASTETAVGTLTSKLEAQINGALTTMENSINAHGTSLASTSSKKRARKTALRTQEIIFEQQDAQISTLSTQLAQTHADAIERRLQEKLTQAMKECQSQVQRHTDLRIADADKNWKKVPKSEPEVKHRCLEQELRDIKQLSRGRGTHFSLPVSHLEPKRPKPAANSVPSRQTISSRSNNLVDAEEDYSTKGTSDQIKQSSSSSRGSTEDALCAFRVPQYGHLHENQSSAIPISSMLEHSAMLKALEKINSGICQILTERQPRVSCSQPTSKWKDASSADKPQALELNQTQHVRAETTTSLNTIEREMCISSMALTHARVAATKQIEGRMLKREQE